LVAEYGNILSSGKHLSKTLPNATIKKENEQKYQLNDQYSIRIPSGSKIDSYRMDYLMLNCDFWDKIEELNLLEDNVRE
jgi:hypothetical protein